MPGPFKFPGRFEPPEIIDFSKYVFAEIVWPKFTLGGPTRRPMWQSFEVSATLYARQHIALPSGEVFDHFLPLTRSPQLWDDEQNNHLDNDDYRVVIWVPELLSGHDRDFSEIAYNAPAGYVVPATTAILGGGAFYSQT